MAEIETIREQVASRCVHYRGTREPCAAGIDIRALVGGEDWGWGNRMPCLRRNPTECVCDARRWPTEEELDAEVAEHEELTQRMMRTIPFIAKLKKTSARDEMLIAKCPECGGKLHYRIASYNGHIHMKCDTDNCIAMME